MTNAVNKLEGLADFKLAMDQIWRITKGLLTIEAKFLIQFEMWRDLKPLGFHIERERERTDANQRERKWKKIMF